MEILSVLHTRIKIFKWSSFISYFRFRKTNSTSDGQFSAFRTLHSDTVHFACGQINRAPFPWSYSDFPACSYDIFPCIADPVSLTLHRDIACIRSKIPVCWHINECDTFHNWFVQILCRIHHISVPFPDRPDIMHNSFRMVQPEIDNSSHPLPLLIFLLSLLS